MTLFSVSGKALMTGKTTKEVPGLGAAIVVSLAFRRSDLNQAERSALDDYYKNVIEVDLAAVEHEVNPRAPRPMDEALARAEANGHPREERARPLPAEECRACGKAIGDDPDCRFYTPPAGPPVPVHGACYPEVERGFALAETPEPAEAYAGTTDPALSEEAKAARAAFLAAINAQEPPSDLRIALVDAYDSGDEVRRHHALVLGGLEQDDNVALPTETIPRAVYLGWLRRGPLQELAEEPSDEAGQGEVDGEDEGPEPPEDADAPVEDDQEPDAGSES